MKYVALFRGINVGKSIQVSMKDIIQIFQNLGLLDVKTYLNSGNALFESSNNKDYLTKIIEETLKHKYQQEIRTLIKTGNEIIEIASEIPSDWVNDTTQKTYVAYLFKEFDYPSLVDQLPIKRDYINIFYRNGCIIWNIIMENYNKSQINKIVNHNSYHGMTTRNSNTARKLAEMCS